MIKLLATASNVMSAYFERPALEFSGIGSIVSQIIANESDPSQIAIVKNGSVLTVYNCDGTVDAIMAPNVSGSYTSTLPVGNTRKHEWTDSTPARFPDATTELSLAGLIDLVVDGLADAEAVIIDQARAHVCENGNFSADFAPTFEEVATFQTEAAQTWE